MNRTRFRLERLQHPTSSTAPVVNRSPYQNRQSHTQYTTKYPSQGSTIKVKEEAVDEFLNNLVRYIYKRRRMLITALQRIYLRQYQDENHQESYRDRRQQRCLWMISQAFIRFAIRQTIVWIHRTLGPRARATLSR